LISCFGYNFFSGQGATAALDEMQVLGGFICAVDINPQLPGVV